MTCGITTTMRLAIVSLLAAVAVTLASASPAAGAVVIDQAFTAGDDLGANINEGCRYVGMTFTAGVSGRLTGVNIDVHSEVGAPPLRVVIRNSRNDRPFGDPIAVRYLRDPQSPMSRFVAFRQDVVLIAGREYAIVVNYRGAEPGAGRGLGIWDGATDGDYAGGRHISGQCPTYSGIRFWRLWDESFDLHFRTYVEPAV